MFVVIKHNTGFQVSRANYDKYAEQPLHYIIYYDYYNKLN